jgi:hypothetical protein
LWWPFASSCIAAGATKIADEAELLEFFRGPFRAYNGDWFFEQWIDGDIVKSLLPPHLYLYPY